MNQPTMRLARRDDAFDLHRRLRATDLRELAAVTSAEPLDVLLEAIEISSTAFAVVRHGHCQVLGGAAPLYEGMGSIWLLASEDIYKWRQAFMHYSRKALAELHEDYPVLTNVVDDRNRTSQAWLRRLGFTPGNRVNHPHSGLPFTQYTSVRT